MIARPALTDNEVIDSGLPPRVHEMTKAEYEAFLQEGIDELERGETIPHELVVAEMRAKYGRR